MRKGSRRCQENRNIKAQKALCLLRFAYHLEILRIASLARYKSLTNYTVAVFIGRPFIFFAHVVHTGAGRVMEFFRVGVDYIGGGYWLCLTCIRRGNYTCTGGSICTARKWYNWRISVIIVTFTVAVSCSIVDYDARLNIINKDIKVYA